MGGSKCSSWLLFHDKVIRARQFTGTRARFCRATSEWSAPPIEGVLEQAGLLPIREYISRRQNTAIEYIATRPIYETALAARRRSAARHLGASDGGIRSTTATTTN